MPTARYGEASQAFIVALDGALHASKPLPVNVPGDTAETAATSACRVLPTACAPAGVVGAVTASQPDTSSAKVAAGPPRVRNRRVIRETTGWPGWVGVRFCTLLPSYYLLVRTGSGSSVEPLPM